jgi:DNA-binding IscR family transcriptional regulator
VTDDDDTDWSAACAVRNVWHAAAEASQRVLESTTIQELVEQQGLIRAHRNMAPSRGIADPSPALLTTDV